MAMRIGGRNGEEEKGGHLTQMGGAASLSG